jgi:hypothetical protein
MEHFYNDLVKDLRNLLIPPPANQLEMEFYYRRVISVLEGIKEQIEDAQEILRHRLEETKQVYSASGYNR